MALSKEDVNFNAEGYPVVKEKVTKTIMIKKPANISDPAEMKTLQYIADLMNIEIKWIVVAADGWNERVNLTFASGEKDLPDIIMKGSIPNLSRVIEDGLVISIDELMEEYSTGLKPLLAEYPGVDASARASDGKLYSLPGVNTLAANLTGHRNLWINKTWLDNLNLKMPETTDELLDVLRAFRDQDANGNGDPNDEIPYAVEDAGAGHSAKPDVIAGLFGAYNNFGYENVMLRGDTVGFLKTSDEWKQTLQYMNIMYAEWGSSFQGKRLPEKRQIPSAS